MTDARYQIIWRWRAFLWPFSICRDEHDGAHEAAPHLVYERWPLWLWLRLKPDWGVSVVYRWIMRVGPLEVRRWVPKKDRAAAIAAHNEATKR